ncbi:MAG: recombination protein O N-terminal domain-containing protein [Muribaculaceae bacterium]|nr:recombination protein O N-terminal domain-containing protein [Muribaculaceae bacterium]
MGEKIRGIVLNVRKYNDRNNVVSIYSREWGRLSFISPAGSGKASNARRARLQPLALIETELNYKAGAELQRLGSVALVEVWRDLYFQPVKQALVLFISEFLGRLLNASMADPRLFDFLEDSFRLLDRMDKGVNDFHIPFLVSLLTFSGIQPDVNGYREGFSFDFAAGGFVGSAECQVPSAEGLVLSAEGRGTNGRGGILYGEEAKAAAWVARINFSNMKRLRLTGANRRQILYGLLNYYSYHFPGLGQLKSVDVLREVFL